MARTAFAHVCYESGDADIGRGFLSSWLADYPRDAAFHGHLSWHLSLSNLGPAIGPWRCSYIRMPSRPTGTGADRSKR